MNQLVVSSSLERKGAVAYKKIRVESRRRLVKDPEYIPSCGRNWLSILSTWTASVSGAYWNEWISLVRSINDGQDRPLISSFSHMSLWCHSCSHLADLAMSREALTTRMNVSGIGCLLSAYCIEQSSADLLGQDVRCICGLGVLQHRRWVLIVNFTLSRIKRTHFLPELDSTSR